MLVPVSYTHLDVYKRQCLDCVYPEVLNYIIGFELVMGHFI